MSRSAGSTPSEIENLRLREEVRLLRDELRQLTVRVDRQEDRLSEVTDSLSVISAVQSFDVVSSASAATPATDQSARVVRDSDLSFRHWALYLDFS